MTDRSLSQQADELERRAREVEGDSDNPLRVAAANDLYDEAAALRAQIPDSSLSLTDVQAHALGKRDYSRLAPQFRPGGTKEPKSLEGVRNLLPHAKSVAPEIVVQLFDYFDAERAKAIALQAHIEALQAALRLIDEKCSGAGYDEGQALSEIEHIARQALERK